MIEIKVNKKLNSFLIKLHKNNIEVLKIKNNKIYIRKKDLDKVEKLITIYDVEIIGPILSLKKINKIFMFSILLSIAFLVFLSNIIFNINIITEDKEVEKLLTTELKKYGIERLKFKKNNLEVITSEIIQKNKNKIEWLYIEEIGTTYNIKVQIREIKDIKKDDQPSNIISSKNAIIKKLEIQKGEILKRENQYVQKGEVIVTGEIKLNEETKAKTKAQGTVYGEVWYKINIKQPLIIYDQINTNTLNINLNLLNKSFNILGYKDKYKLNTMFPIGLQISKSTPYKISTILNYEEAKIKAIENTNTKINSKLSDNEHIISHQILKEKLIDSKIELEIFYTVYEDITEYKLLE